MDPIYLFIIITSLGLIAYLIYLIAKPKSEHFLDDELSCDDVSPTILFNESIHFPVPGGDWYQSCYSVDYINKRCTYGRLIGDKNFRGKGVGTEALVLALKYVELDRRNLMVKAPRPREPQKHILYKKNF